MVKKIIVVFLVLFISSCANRSYFSAQKINEQVKERTATIILREGNSLEQITYSTGFFIEYNKKKYCVTTAHILYDAIRKGFHKENLKAEVLLNNQTIQMKHFLKTSENDGIDVWIFKPTSEDESVPAFSVSRSMKEKTLSPGTDIIFCGFPEAFQSGNKLSFTYMTRKCIIAAISYLSAQDLRSIYIIDSLVNPGDSGSPVINLANAELVGYVKGFRYNPQTPTKELGLGVVIPINYVLKIIDKTEKALAGNLKTQQ